MIESWNSENDLSIYERAQEAAYHTDMVMWEITAIIWGANTLLMGFILEAIDSRRALPLIILFSVVGMVLTAFVARICAVARIAKRIGYGICQRIEKAEQFPADLRLHTKIHECYPAGMARRWVYGVSILFSAAWLAVIVYALWLFLCRASTA
jgi:hypothetical protein